MILFVKIIVKTELKSVQTFALFDKNKQKNYKFQPLIKFRFNNIEL
jgi:hypothetical protein